MVESFWAVPDIAGFRTPLAILREQAAALTEGTNGALVGTVSTSKIMYGAGGHSTDLALSLSVEVPALDDYAYRLLEYRQPVDLYPGTLSLSWEEGPLFIGDEIQFVSAIRSALSSDKVRRIMGSLLAQATAA